MNPNLLNRGVKMRNKSIIFLTLLLFTFSCHFVDVESNIRNIKSQDIDSLEILEFGYWNILMKDKMTIDSNIMFTKNQLSSEFVNSFVKILHNVEAGGNYYLKDDSTSYIILIYYDTDRIIKIMKYGPSSSNARINIRKKDEDYFPLNQKNITYSDTFYYSDNYIPKFIKLLNELIEIENKTNNNNIKKLYFNENYELRDN